MPRSAGASRRRRARTSPKLHAQRAVRAHLTEGTRGWQRLASARRSAAATRAPAARLSFRGASAVACHSSRACRPRASFRAARRALRHSLTSRRRWAPPGGGASSLRRHLACPHSRLTYRRHHRRPAASAETPVLRLPLTASVTMAGLDRRATSATSAPTVRTAASPAACRRLSHASHLSHLSSLHPLLRRRFRQAACVMTPALAMPSSHLMVCAMTAARAQSSVTVSRAPTAPTAESRAARRTRRRHHRAPCRILHPHRHRGRRHSRLDAVRDWRSNPGLLVVRSARLASCSESCLCVACRPDARQCAPTLAPDTPRTRLMASATTAVWERITLTARRAPIAMIAWTELVAATAASRCRRHRCLHRHRHCRHRLRPRRRPRSHQRYRHRQRPPCCPCHQTIHNLHARRRRRKRRHRQWCRPIRHLHPPSHRRQRPLRCPRAACASTLATSPPTASATTVAPAATTMNVRWALIATIASIVAPHAAKCPRRRPRRRHQRPQCRRQHCRACLLHRPHPRCRSPRAALAPTRASSPSTASYRSTDARARASPGPHSPLRRMPTAWDS